MTNSMMDSASRAVRLLEALASLEQPASLQRITAATGYSKASTYRMLRALQEDGFIDHIGRSGYRLGNRAVALATLMGPRPALLKRAQPVLARLATLSGETTSMHLKSGDHRTPREPSRVMRVLYRRHPDYAPTMLPLGSSVAFCPNSQR